MELFDFYKLLNIPVGTSIEDVKKAYILKVHQFSGAYNEGDEKAAEYLQVIARGYELLSDPDRKRVYDLMLLSHYLKQKNSDINRSLYKKYGSSERNPTKDEAEDSEAESGNIKRKKTEFTEEQLNVAKQGIKLEQQQLGVAAICLVLLFFIFDFIYWKPYTDYTMVSFVFMAVSYVILMIWTLMKLYRFFEVRNLILQRKVSSEKWILVCFLVMFFAIPAFAMRLEYLRKNYHLSHYAAQTRAKDFMLEDAWLTVDYEVNGTQFRQSISLGDHAIEFKKYNYDRSKFFVKYSTKNPKIISIVMTR